MSRVDVSKKFSADQLWFRIISGLFERSLLPENLWTAPIQLRQRWKRKFSELRISADFHWNSADSKLNSVDFLWNSADSELSSVDFLWNSANSELSSVDFLWNSADFWRIQKDNSSFFRTFRITSNLRHIIEIFSPIGERNLTLKLSLFNLLTGRRFYKKLKVWAFCYWSGNKTDMVEFFKNIFPFSGMNFHESFKKFEFLLSFYRILWEIFTFWLRGMPFYWPLHVFSSLLTTLSQFDIPISMYKYQRWFRKSQSWLALK